ncbi:MAG: epimerase [Marivirga sp.]|nr:epimerase [Marivirga sp.]
MIAITGANGLLGSYIVRKLISQNEPFIAIKRKGSDISLLHDVNEKITWFDADILDTVSLSDAFKDATHVIHAAAVVSFNPRRADQVMDINVQGTRNVVNVCLALGIKRLVHISSVAALGRQKGQPVIDENNKWVDAATNSTYAKSKYFAELEVFRGQEEGISTVIVNPSLILAGANWNVSSAQLFKYVWQQKPFYIDGFVNYVDVLDLTEITYALLHSDIEGERFIASAGKISYKDFFGMIAKEFNKKAPSIQLGKNFLKIGAFLEGLISGITGAEPRLTPETARLAGSEFLFQNQKIRNKLKFEFQPIDGTLRRCCLYYIEKMKAKK